MNDSNNTNKIITILFIYSKYSESSRFLMQFVANFHFIQILCIDNPDVRKQILNSQVKVTRVPCILIYNSFGTVEMFEGRKAFEWVNYNVYPIFSNSEPQKQSLQNQIINEEQHYEQSQSQQQQLQQQEQYQEQHIQNIQKGTPIDMIPMISQDEKIDENNNNDRSSKIDNSVKAKAEELERVRNSLLFKEPPSMGGMKSGGPMNDVTNSIRQK